MRNGIHRAIQDQTFIPLFCVSSTSNIGVARLCDFIAKYGSSPDDRKIVIAITIFLSSGDEPYFAIKSHRRATPIFEVEETQNSGINV